MERIPFQSSCDYFHSRPKSSQIGAVVSRQSTPVPNRDVRTKTELLLVKHMRSKAKLEQFLLVSKAEKCRTGGEVQGHGGAHA